MNGEIPPRLLGIVLVAFWARSRGARRRAPPQAFLEGHAHCHRVPEAALLGGLCYLLKEKTRGEGDP